MAKRILQAVAMVCISAVGLWAADDPLVGTWKVNIAKSTASPDPLPKSQIVKIEPWEGGRKLTAEIVNANGNSTKSEYSAKFDGKDYPWKGNANADTVSIKIIDDHTVESLWKKGGKATLTSRSVLSADGKMWTNTQTGKDAQGRTVKNVTVYEKQ
jgi:hypothetical protein